MNSRASSPLPRRVILRGGLATFASLMGGRLLSGCDSPTPADAGTDAGPDFDAVLGSDAPLVDAHVSPDAFVGTSFQPNALGSRPALRSLLDEIGALEAVNADGLRLPPGFTARILATSGEMVPGTNNANTGAEESFSNQKNEPFSFGADEAIAFSEDRQGRVWIGGKYAGLYVYDPATRRFYNYRHNPAREGSLSSNRVNCVFTDATGVVWLGTNNGINIYYAAQQQFEQEFLPAFDQAGNKPFVIYDFLKDSNGTLWIGTSKGLYLKQTDGRYQFKKINYKGSELSITRFYKDNDGTMYLGTDYSLFRYDLITGSVTLLANTEKDQVMAKLIESRIVSIVKDTIDKHPVLLTAPYGHFFSYYDLTEQRNTTHSASACR